MEGAPLPFSQTPKEEIKKSYEIKQEDDNFLINIKIINQDIILNVLDVKNLIKEYEIQLTFDELKSLHKIFVALNSCQDFIDFIEASIQNKKILIKKNKESGMTIELKVEYLFKQNIISLDLNKKKMSFELTAQDLYQKISNTNEICKSLEISNNKLIEENNILKQENKKLKDKYLELEEKIIFIEKNLMNRINNLEIKMNSCNNEIISLKNDNASNMIAFDSKIMEKNEFSMIHFAIEKKMNKKIKKLKKIYQATKDGGDPITFHKLCDGISNTLVLYQSEGDRRFGGFTSQCWKSEGGLVSDKNCFLFSLDKKKIYYSNEFRISNKLKYGPDFCYNDCYIIELDGNALKNEILKTNEGRNENIFDGDENALSEDGGYKGVYAKEYEVFQIIFE